MAAISEVEVDMVIIMIEEVEVEVIVDQEVDHASIKKEILVGEPKLQTMLKITSLIQDGKDF